MHRRKLTVLALAAVAVAAVGLTGASGATGQQGRFQTIAGGTVTGIGSAPALSNKMVTYILEMSAKPVAVVDAASKAAGHGALSSKQRAALTRQISMRQAPVVASVSRLHGAQVTQRYQGVYNGIAVMLPQREAWKLASISGVKAVFASKLFTPTQVAPGFGVPLTRAPAAWGGVGAYTGTGMKLAVIDTGIDYTHAMFGGTGTTAAWNCAHAHGDDVAPDLATAQANFAANCPGVSNWYSGTKVKGGTDLVGDAYNAAAPPLSPALTPHPDFNPLDCNGHGSHVAGTAAGFGVAGNGSTYGGPYNANTINNTSFIISPGMAPNASVYAVRVFGCSGSVDDTVLIQAMNWAFNNGMDAVNMSLGASFGSPGDADSVAASNLANDGVITVLSAGNSGPNPYITGSPGAGTSTISVAANDATASLPGATLTLTKADLSAGGTMASVVTNGVAVPAGPFTIRVVTSDVFSPFGPATVGHTISRGCSVADDEAGNGGSPWPAGTILVVERGSCARVGKAVYAQQAGASAMIMVNTSGTSYPPYEGPITSNPDTGLPYVVTIPSLYVLGGSNPGSSANGVKLRNADGGTLTTVSAPIANLGYLALASFSSGGPAGGGLLKPDVTAPGAGIISTGMGTGNGGVFLSGTSMASPHTAGEALLVKQAHPTWGGPLGDATQYWKDAIVNTANPSLVASYAVRNAGAGEIDAYNATHTHCVADGSPTGTASLSFGVPNAASGHYTGTATITLHNFTSSACDFRMSVASKQGVRHSVHLFSGNSNAPLMIRVPANGTATVSVQLDVLRAAMADPVTVYNDCWGGASCQYDDAAGLIHFRAINGSNHGIALNVPYYVAPTEVSKVKIDGIDSAALANGATDGNVVLRNPNGGKGYADWFSWGGSSPVVGGIGSADLLNVGVQSFPDGSNTADATSFVEFALNTTTSWSNPAADVAEIDIDVDGDNVPDYAVVSQDLGGRTAGAVNGEAAVVVYNLHVHPNTFVIHYLTGAMFNGTTMELLARFSDLCAAPAPCISAGTPIKYVTFMIDRNGGQDVIGSEDLITGNITSAAATFNVFQPSLSTLHGSSDTIGRNGVVPDPVTIDSAAWTANPQLGILVLAQNNQNTVGEALTFALSF